MPTAEDFRREVANRLREAELKGATELAINAGQMHRKLGGYPSKAHVMPVCCNAMRDAMSAGDRVVQTPPKGRGASLTISYTLPRKL